MQRCGHGAVQPDTAGQPHEPRSQPQVPHGCGAPGDCEQVGPHAGCLRAVAGGVGADAGHQLVRLQLFVSSWSTVSRGTLQIGRKATRTPQKRSTVQYCRRSNSRMPCPVAGGGFRWAFWWAARGCWAPPQRCDTSRELTSRSLRAACSYWACSQVLGSTAFWC